MHRRRWIAVSLALVLSAPSLAPAAEQKSVGGRIEEMKRKRNMIEAGKTETHPYSLPEAEMPPQAGEAQISPPPAPEAYVPPQMTATESAPGALGGKVGNIGSPYGGTASAGRVAEGQMKSAPVHLPPGGAGGAAGKPLFAPVMGNAHAGTGRLPPPASGPHAMPGGLHVEQGAAHSEGSRGTVSSLAAPHRMEGGGMGLAPHDAAPPQSSGASTGEGPLSAGPQAALDGIAAARQESGATQGGVTSLESPTAMREGSYYGVQPSASGR